MSEFFEYWAELRQAMASGQVEDPGRCLTRLTELAADARERVLIAPVEIQMGALLNMPNIHARGVQTLRGAPLPERVEALGAMNDLTVLGTVTARRSIVVPALRDVAGDDQLVDFIESPSLPLAQLLAAGHWKSSRKLPPPLEFELRRFAGWTALDSYVRYRDVRYLNVINNERLRLEDEPGAWEYKLIEALTELVKGSTDVALRRQRRIGNKINPESPRARFYQRYVTAFCPFAGSRVDEWIEHFPAGPPGPQNAVEPAERLGAYFIRMAEEAGKPNRVLDNCIEDLRLSPHLLFLFFIAAPDATRRRLALELLKSIRTADDPRRWPWPGRTSIFCDSVAKLNDAELELALLSAAAVVRHPVLIKGCLECIERSSASELASANWAALQDLLAQDLSGLNPAKQRMLQRGAVWRVIIDGSNLCFGAKSSSYGAKPSFAYLEQAVKELREFGFEELVCYFDRSTRYHPAMDPETWAKIQRLDAQGKATIVGGQADKYVIEDFLAAPAVTWVVTNDLYRDYGPQFPKLAEWWPSHRLAFHVNQQGTLRWERPLDQPTRRPHV